MKVLKRIVNYLFWTVIALVCAFGYLLVILGLPLEETTWFNKMFNFLYNLAFIYIGLPLGGLIALIYILLDLFYLRKKLQSNFESAFLRLFVILGITMCLGAIHYFLEKVIDVI
jgi:TRAP-type C4-dicarboxylate transport system permease small subunit